MNCVNEIIDYCFHAANMNRQTTEINPMKRCILIIFRLQYTYSCRFLGLSYEKSQHCNVEILQVQVCFSDISSAMICTMKGLAEFATAEGSTAVFARTGDGGGINQRSA